MADSAISERTKVNTKLKPPSLYKVIYLNDNVTTQQFVVESLIGFFDHTPESAHEVMLQVHEEGAGIAATLPYEIAEQKGVEVTVLARGNGFPLQIKLEPEQ